MNTSRKHPTREAAVLARINEIMDTFDFGRMRRVMETLNWKWMMPPEDGGIHGAESRVPDEYEIRRAARKSLNRAAEERCCTSSGGLMVLYRDGNNRDDGEFFFLDLFFVAVDGSDDGVSYGEGVEK